MFWALCVLDDAFDAAGDGPIAPGPGLRLALALLYAVGDRREEWFDREPYETFWQRATMPATGASDAAAFGRVQDMTSSFNAIARAAGMERDVPLMAAMRRARGKR